MIPEKKPLRLVPGIIIAGLMLLLKYVLPLIVSGDAAASIGALGPLAGGLLIIVWWAFFSRAAKADRFGGAGLMILCLALTPAILHVSIRTGMVGMMYYVLALAPLCGAFVLWAVLTRNAKPRLKRLTMTAVILAGCGVWGLFRSDGITGVAGVNLAWRWTVSAEDKLLATGDALPAGTGPRDAVDTAAVWPGFRGADRDAAAADLRIGTAWDKTPPRELWSRPVGPGVGSFAVKSGRFFTQEQRGEEEIVACYDLATGSPVWKHADRARFYDSHAGAGPRGTPTLADGRVYALGATGILNVLDEKDGSVVWSRNAVDDTEVKIPVWGVASSPLVTDKAVIVAAVGRPAAYGKEDGKLLWTGPDGGNGYSSPHLHTIAGVPQVILMADSGVTSFAPATGSILWTYPLKGEHILQPALLPGGDLLLDAAGKGMHRVTPVKEEHRWIIKVQWISKSLKPTFNDFLVHKNHAYGLSGRKLVCINLDTGERTWKGGRYGGQLLLLPEQDLILVLTEKGNIVLVEADPAAFKEIASIPAVEGKTWNHPALAGNILLVRNTKEMAAFRLPEAAR